MRSTHNTRIERLWVEVGKQFMRPWRAFFLRLERSYHLTRSNKSHIWLLNKLYVPMINEDCKQFVRTWNNHPIDNKDIKHMASNVSPLLIESICTLFMSCTQDLFLMGQLENGTYKTLHGDMNISVTDSDSESDGDFNFQSDDEWCGVAIEADDALGDIARRVRARIEQSSL